MGYFLTAEIYYSSVYSQDVRGGNNGQKLQEVGDSKSWRDRGGLNPYVEWRQNLSFQLVCWMSFIRVWQTSKTVTNTFQRPPQVHLGFQAKGSAQTNIDTRQRSLPKEAKDYVYNLAAVKNLPAEVEFLPLSS